MTEEQRKALVTDCVSAFFGGLGEACRDCGDLIEEGDLVLEVGDRPLCSRCFRAATK